MEKQNARMPLEALSPEVFKGEVDNSVLSYRNTSPVFISLNFKKRQKEMGSKSNKKPKGSLLARLIIVESLKRIEGKNVLIENEFQRTV